MAPSGGRVPADDDVVREPVVRGGAGHDQGVRPRWQQPWDLFAYGLAEMRRLAPGEEIVIAETATAEAGGSKAEWNAHPVHYLAQQPDVTGLVWFHPDEEVDRRINSSTASAQSLAAELAERPCP